MIEDRNREEELSLRRPPTKLKPRTRVAWKVEMHTMDRIQMVTIQMVSIGYTSASTIRAHRAREISATGIPVELFGRLCNRRREARGETRRETINAGS